MLRPDQEPMTNILTAAEADALLRGDGTLTEDAELLALLPIVDATVKAATGRAWEDDATIHPLAKSAARIILVQMYENPAMQSATGLKTLDLGATNALAQLEAVALRYRKYQFEGINGAGDICLEAARQGDVVIALVGIYESEGDQSANFESAISNDYYINQTSSSDLSDNLFLVTLMSAKDYAESQ